MLKSLFSSINSELLTAGDPGPRITNLTIKYMKMIGFNDSMVQNKFVHNAILTCLCTLDNHKKQTNHSVLVNGRNALRHQNSQHTLFLHEDSSSLVSVRQY